MLPDRTLGLAALVLTLAAPAARAQTGADSSRATVLAPDADTDSIRYPVRDRALDITGILARTAGSFSYDFGTPGWPDGWSPMGLDPRAVTVELNGIPFEDPVTGAPIWEFMPVAQMDPLRTFVVSHGRSDVVRADFRRTFPARPLTEIRYRSAAGGLQAVDVTHAQTRRAGAFSRATLVLGYGGAGAHGEYDGSSLRKKRRLTAGLELERGDWTFGVSDLFNKNSVGAHDGVQPLTGQAYESIYNRLLADVENPTAERIRVRNDLVLLAEGPVAGVPLSIRAYRSNSTLQYRSPDDTTTARTARIGLVAGGPVRIARTPVHVDFSVFTEGVRSGNAFSTWPGRSLTAHASVSVIRSIGEWTVDASTGVSSFDGSGRASAHLAVERSSGPLRVHALAALAHVPRSAVELHGFGPTFSGTAEARPSAHRRVEGGVEVVSDPIRLGITGFLRQTTDPLLLVLDASADTARAVVDEDAVGTGGVTVSAGIRARRNRGVYLEGSATWNPHSKSGNSLTLRASEAVPEVHGLARLGVRAAFFGGDLDADIAVQARSWISTGGLRLHAPTGLLALPDPASRDLPGSSIIDVTIDARVRSATVFLALENILSGTTLITGNQLVPDYPYPERRFRFGVYWPMFD